jgi:hypothetical protein
LVGTGIGRLRALLASCSEPIAWYMSNPTNAMNLYVRYGANAAIAISTIPAMGSLTEARSASIGAETWVIATRNITTRTSLEQIRATTNIAHFPIHPREASQDAPLNASGANTTATSRSAFLTRRDSHTIAAAVIARPAMKIVMMAPTPGAAMLMPTSPAARRAILSPIDSVVSPAACTIPMHSWSTTSSSSAVSVMTTNDPRTDLARPRAARVSAVGSRRIRPVMSWRQK